MATAVVMTRDNVTLLGNFLRHCGSTVAVHQAVSTYTAIKAVECPATTFDISCRTDKKY